MFPLFHEQYFNLKHVYSGLIFFRVFGQPLSLSLWYNVSLSIICNACIVAIW